MKTITSFVALLFLITIYSTEGFAKKVRMWHEKDQVILDSFIAKKDSSLCLNVIEFKNNEDKINLCVFRIAMAASDPKQCMYGSLLIKSICVGSVAFQLKKIEICDDFFKNKDIYHARCNFYATGEDIKLEASKA